MRRRDAAVLMGALALNGPVWTAQRTPRIGRLSEGGPPSTDTLDSFRGAMREFGHPAVLIEARQSGAQYERLPELAAELVALNVDVIWSIGTIATAAAKAATRTVPIVMVSASPIESPYLLQHRALLAELALKHRLPAIYALQEHVQAGGLCSYGVNFRVLTERVAYYVARILDGARPAELPVEQPTRYELVIHRAAADAMGLVIPPSLLMQAERVIG